MHPGGFGVSSEWEWETANYKELLCFQWSGIIRGTTPCGTGVSSNHLFFVNPPGLPVLKALENSLAFKLSLGIEHK